MHFPTVQGAALALTLFSTLQQKIGGNVESIVPSASLQNLTELPGGTPFTLCPVSSSSDLFQITSVELTKQPVYIDDIVLVHIYGSFQETWPSTARMHTRIDCGSHCEMYGAPPGTGSSSSIPYCNNAIIEQPLGGRKKNDSCSPEKGYALIEHMIYVWPWAVRTPAWYNFTFDALTAEGQRIYCLTAEVCMRWEKPEDNEHYPEGPWNNCSWPR